MTSTHPLVPLKPWKPFLGRPLLPARPPSDPATYPSLPSSIRKQPFSTFTLSTHIIPAVHLRRGPRLPIPKLPSDDLSKDEKTYLTEKLSEGFQRNMQDPIIKNDKHENVLWNVLNRYVKKGLTSSESTGITLFFAHANGFPKEIWEPILARIFESPVSGMIDEVWAWESVQHGDAGLINAAALTSFFDWSDNTRDIFNFLLHFLPSMPCDKTLPVHLARVSKEESQQRVQRGFQSRTLILIGHSFGGTSLALGAYHYPKIPSSIILVDPTMMRPEYSDAVTEIVGKWGLKAINNALRRKDTWKSKEEALIEFSSSPYYATWDRDMLKTYIEFALYDTTVTTPTGETKPVARLKLAPFHEALVFAGGDVPLEAFACLPDLDERIRLHWIVSGAKGAPEFGAPGAQQERVWVRPKNSSNTRINRAGHLVPQEGAPEFAQDLIQFLQRHYSNRTIRASL
ncbi:hypothetical protein D9756_007809 [Leucocoprinus leucothites]|uniref:AB hydrolase-1 domain-containing protein n=1 Tax=Leucocoprinus leucothites TaxID=201217 RepID=A0A8H5D491_9AGAR|nr:hypothetical protein D9756_007809 [Leucoagaricus leucothites]